MLSVILTLACPDACSPDWRSDWISEEDLAAILKQLSGKISPSPYHPIYGLFLPNVDEIVGKCWEIRKNY